MNSEPSRRLAFLRNDRLTNVPVFGLIALLYVVDLGRTPVYFGGMWKVGKVVADVDNRPTVAILRKTR